MKNYVYKFALCIAVTFMSCSDQLERFPADELVEETAYNNVDDLQRGLAGAIGNFSYTPIIGFNSIFTDNTKIGVDNGGQEQVTHGQILTSETGDRGLWTSRYGVINDFNRLLAAAQDITPSSDEQDEYNNILAQSYAFRALAHYELLLYYGFDMMNPSSPGVPYVDYVATSALPSRNTTGEVLAGIQADLDNALDLFPAGTSNVNFATPDFVTFLRARIALETGDYTGAIGYCTDLIADYSLATPLEYFNMFNGDTDTTEVIWKYDNVQGFNYNYANLWIFTGTGGAFIEMSNGLYAELDDNDIRKAVLVDPDSDPSENLFIIGKYPPGADTNYINDYKAMRLSEIYLIRAEAYARTSQFGLAAADVLAVRTARTVAGAPSPINYQDLNGALTNILAERRIELAFEGHRYIDIKRMRSVLNEGINRDPSDCIDGIPCTLPPNSPKFTFPVPQVEVNANPNILPQPDGY